VTNDHASKEHEYRLLARIAALERLVAEAVPLMKWYTEYDDYQAPPKDHEGIKDWLDRAAGCLSAQPAEVVSGKKEKP